MWTILYHSTEGSNLASVWTTTWTGYSHFALHATQGKTMKSRVGERCRRIRSHLGSKSKDEQQVIQSHFATLVRRRATAPTGVERRTLRYFRVVPRRRRGRRELRCLACDERATSPARSFHAVYQRHLEEIGYRPISFAGYMACINGEQHRASRVSRSCPVAAGPSTTVGIAQQGALLPKPSNKAPSSSQVPQEDSDEKIIHLSGSARRTACSGIQVVKV